MRPKRQHTDAARITLEKLRAEPRWVKDRKGATALAEHAQGGVPLRQLAVRHGVTLDTLRAYMYRVKFNRRKDAELALATVCSMYAYPQMGEFLRRYDELHPPASVTQ